ncbi:MAG: heat-inducible transcriptional repressor HrcA, partial [Bifidobacterium mongoliense]|nr:heat-inducible transcriptional repressor HrcA [Bifidobacterium mongoliense]
HNPGLIHASVVSSGYGRSPETADETGTDTETGSERQAKGEHADPVAFVGSIGPTHMDYGATMTAVRTVARYLTGLLAQDEDDDGH